MSAWLALGLLIIASLLLAIRPETATIAGLDHGQFASLAFGLVVLLFLGSSLFFSYQGQGSKALRDMMIWLSLLLALVTLYSFRFEFQSLGQRVARELVPGYAASSIHNAQGQTIVRIARSQNGHFITRVRINGAPVQMLVDTGASSVVLTPQDARRAGIDTSRLSYSLPVSTANGRTMVASVRLHAVAIGDIGERDILAQVSAPGALSQSLLGMSFLSRLTSYEVKNGTLILRR